MRFLNVLLLAWALHVSAISYAAVWGIDYNCYRSVGHVLDWGVVELTYVNEIRGNEENFWLTVRYKEFQDSRSSEGEEKTFRVYASRLWDEGSPFRLFALDGHPIGNGSFSIDDKGTRTYEYNIGGLADTSIKLTRVTTVSNFSDGTEKLSAVMTIDGKTTTWNVFKSALERYTPCP